MVNELVAHVNFIAYKAMSLPQKILEYMPAVFVRDTIADVKFVSMRGKGNVNRKNGRKFYEIRYRKIRVRRLCFQSARSPARRSTSYRAQSIPQGTRCLQDVDRTAGLHQEGSRRDGRERQVTAGDQASDVGSFVWAQSSSSRGDPLEIGISITSCW